MCVCSLGLLRRSVVSLVSASWFFVIYDDDCVRACVRLFVWKGVLQQVNESVLLPVLKAIGYTVQTEIKREQYKIQYTHTQNSSSRLSLTGNLQATSPQANYANSRCWSSIHPPKFRRSRGRRRLRRRVPSTSPVRIIDYNCVLI